jgi:hypothetical protein
LSAVDQPANKLSGVRPPAPTENAARASAASRMYWETLTPARAASASSKAQRSAPSRTVVTFMALRAGGCRLATAVSQSQLRPGSKVPRRPGALVHRRDVLDRGAGDDDVEPPEALERR